MSPLDQARLESSRSRLLQIAEELKTLAPMIAMRISADAREVELKIARMSR